MRTSFIIIIILYVLANAYIFTRIWQGVGMYGTVSKIIYILLAVLLAASMFIFFAFADHIPIPLASFLYKTGSSWLIIVLYGFMFFLLRDLFLLADKWWHFVPVEATKLSKLSLWIVLAISTITLIGGYINYQVKRKVELTIKTDKPVPSGNLKIVAVSDLHLGYTINEKELKRWVKLINAEKPDIVLIAGDIIDNSLRPLNGRDFDKYLREIDAPLGVYTCLGNHEYISQVEPSEHFFERSDIRFLKDSAVLIDEQFYIIGRDDRSNRNRKPLKELVGDLDTSKPLIVLDHQPYNLEEAGQNGIDLQLSGHTHRGQVWPMTWVTDHIYEISHGLIKKGNTYIYVSSGLGIWGGKFRIGSQSEYVVINLQN